MEPVKWHVSKETTSVVARFSITVGIEVRRVSSDIRVLI